MSEANVEMGSVLSGASVPSHFTNLPSVVQGRAFLLQPTATPTTPHHPHGEQCQTSYPRCLSVGRLSHRGNALLYLLQSWS